MLLNHSSDHVLVIADGAAFGSEMEKVVKLQDEMKNFALYLPESFEWIILKSDLIKEKSVDEILDNPSEHIESEQYFSWERFFTALLIKTTESSYLQYSKHALNPVYLQESSAEKILDVMHPIKLK